VSDATPNLARRVDGSASPAAYAGDRVVLQLSPGGVLVVLGVGVGLGVLLAPLLPDVAASLLVGPDAPEPSDPVANGRP